jgi:hypothetical protein
LLFLCAAEEQLQDCCDAVAALGEAVPAEVLQPFQLSLAGLSHFNHKVSSLVPTFYMQQRDVISGPRLQ